MEKAITDFESKRLALQGRLDTEKDAAERNRMGQFATPTRLAVDMLRYAGKQLRDSEKCAFSTPRSEPALSIPPCAKRFRLIA